MTFCQNRGWIPGIWEMIKLTILWPCLHEVRAPGNYTHQLWNSTIPSGPPPGHSSHPTCSRCCGGGGGPGASSAAPPSCRVDYAPRTPAPLSGQFAWTRHEFSIMLGSYPFSAYSQWLASKGVQKAIPTHLKVGPIQSYHLVFKNGLSNMAARAIYSHRAFEMHQSSSNVLQV